MEKFILISTDKAINPTSIMGCTKRVSELYVNYLWKKHKKTQFIITRFGNVLGSSGSVIPNFIEFINNDMDLLITNENVSRYFMNISEAAKLIILASCIGSGGNIILFEMGDQIKIVDLAKKLLKMLKIEHLKIKITELRPGEKMYEELHYNKETLVPTKYNKLLLLYFNEFDLDDFYNKYLKLITIKYENENLIRKLLKDIVPEFNNSEFNNSEFNNSEFNNS